MEIGNKKKGKWSRSGFESFQEIDGRANEPKLGEFLGKFDSSVWKKEEFSLYTKKNRKYGQK